MKQTSTRAFTLNELLIVIAILVLLSALAVPAFNALTGSRSIEGATNQISAFLGQARTEAIGVQEVRGVMFFWDRSEERIQMAQVREAFTGPTGIVYLDLSPDRDIITLPPGVGLQTIDNPCLLNMGTPTAAVPNDRYLGFNNPESPAGLAGAAYRYYGGAILFDGFGKLMTGPYGLHCTTAANSTNIAAAGPSGVYSAMGAFLATESVVDAGTGSANNFTENDLMNPFTGQLGIVLFDKDGYANSVSGVTTTGLNEDWQIGNNTPISGDEMTREDWLGNNGTHLLINRYNGTLVKGE